MIETIQWNEPLKLPEKPQKAVFSTTSNDRTAGSIPVWGKPQTPTQQVQQNLAYGQNAQSIEPYGSAYQSPNPVQASEEFTFGDLIDMANPLHHIPLVNIAYREITGDTIKPIGSIIGGAIFGGAIGAAGGAVNAIVQAETGKDIGDNALTMIRGEDRPSLRINNEATPTRTARSNETIDWTNPDIKEAPKEDYSLALLTFGDLKQDLPISKPQKRAPTYNA